MGERVIRCAGIMSGTSLDGLDIACCAFTDHSIKRLWSQSFAYPHALRQRILACQEPGFRASSYEWLRLNADFSRWVSASCQKTKRPHIWAMHGQTIAHAPSDFLTWQLGDPSVLAEATGTTVVSHFRHGDMAAGGEGAPLVPAYLGFLYPEPQALLLNIGGIANITCLKRGKPLMAFDTGPGNMLIDMAAQLVHKRYDAGGRMALRGQPNHVWVKNMLATHPFFQLRPPKSTGRDAFRLSKMPNMAHADLMATVSELTVQSVKHAMQYLPKSYAKTPLLVSGGGSKNAYLLEGLGATPAAHSQMLEAEAFAFLGFQSLRGRALGGKATGARRMASPGWITPGRNWAQVHELIGAYL